MTDPTLDTALRDYRRRYARPEEHRPFHAAILAQPFERGPALVYADWLDEQQHPGGEMLRLLHSGLGRRSGLFDQLRLLPHLGAIPEGDWHRQVGRLGTGHLSRLFTVASALTPIDDGRRVHELIGDPAAHAELGRTLLHAAGILPSKALRDAYAQRAPEGALGSVSANTPEGIAARAAERSSIPNARMAASDVPYNMRLAAHNVAHRAGRDVNAAALVAEAWQGQAMRHLLGSPNPVARRVRAITKQLDTTPEDFA